MIRKPPTEGSDPPDDGGPATPHATSEALQAYVDDLFVDEPAELADLRTELEARRLPLIQVPARVGRVLELVARMIGARRVVEVGTLGGYSALWILRGMPPDGILVTLEREPEHARLARAHFRQAGVEDRVDLREGDARDILPGLGPDGGWDLVFVDADKEGYTAYLEHAARLLRPGGVVVADNALWKGRVVDPEPDDATEGIRRFNAALAGRPDFRGTILPVGDGLAVGVRE